MTYVFSVLGTISVPEETMVSTRGPDSNDPKAMVTGQYFYHQQRRDPEPAARNEEIQERLIAERGRTSGAPVFSVVRSAQLRPYASMGPASRMTNQRRLLGFLD
jgi:hypothetical protein